jgi:hypothetical protein
MKKYRSLRRSLPMTNKTETKSPAPVLDFSDLDLGSVLAGTNQASSVKQKRAPKPKPLSREEEIAAAAERARNKPSPWRLVASTFVVRKQLCVGCGASISVAQNPTQLAVFENCKTGARQSVADHAAVIHPGLPAELLELEPERVECCASCFVPSSVENWAGQQELALEDQP